MYLIEFININVLRRGVKKNNFFRLNKQLLHQFNAIIKGIILVYCHILLEEKTFLWILNHGC